MDMSDQDGIAKDQQTRDELIKLISHLHAQTNMICGECLDNFMRHNDEIKSNYLWSICDLAERSLALLGNIDNQLMLHFQSRNR